MFRAHNLIVLLLAFTLTAATASAQLPINGSWEILTQDGAPIRPGADIGMDIRTDSGGEITGEAWIDRRDGAGPQPIDSEQSTLTPIGVGGLNYLWENAAGNLGLIYWSADREQFESMVLTGPNAGRVTSMRRR